MINETIIAASTDYATTQVVTSVSDQLFNIIFKLVIKTALVFFSILGIKIENAYVQIVSGVIIAISTIASIFDILDLFNLIMIIASSVN